MIEFFSGLVLGLAFGSSFVIELQAFRMRHAATQSSPTLDATPRETDEEPEEYEDPGKVERQKELEAYRRLLREEFGVDQTGTVIHGE